LRSLESRPTLCGEAEGYRGAQEWRRSLIASSTAALILLLLVILLGCTKMTTGSVASGCGLGTFVVAYDVGIFDDPTPALNKEASRVCPMGYDRLGENRLYDGKVINWPIQCHTAIGQTVAPATPPTHC
jgi:hypothetical protein